MLGPCWADVEDVCWVDTTAAPHGSLVCRSKYPVEVKRGDHEHLKRIICNLCGGRAPNSAQKTSILLDLGTLRCGRKTRGRDNNIIVPKSILIRRGPVFPDVSVEIS